MTLLLPPLPQEFMLRCNLRQSSLDDFAML